MMSRQEIGGALTLGARAMGALVRMAADRVSEGLGRALPRTALQLVQPGVIDELLRAGGPPDGGRLPPVRAARLAGVDFESSNCTNFLVDVEFEQADGATHSLPKTFYAKLPCEEVATRAFANAVGFWDVEARFCERVASQVPIRVPQVYAVSQRGTRFVLLLENLQELPGAVLFINRDMAAGTTPDRARMCLRTFAELHAAFWGWSEEQREALLPVKLHPYLAPGGRAATRALNAAAIGPAHKKAPDVFTRDHADVCRLAIQKWDALTEAWYSEPLTLIHGDSHLANCFEYASQEGPRIGLIDFQGTQWCKGIRDVQYHLIDSLEPDVLAAHEGELIDYYVSELAGHGITLDAAGAREQYRALSFQTLMVAVVSLGLGSLTERDDTVRTVLRRSVAAIDRLGFADWVDAL